MNRYPFDPATLDALPKVQDITTEEETEVE